MKGGKVKLESHETECKLCRVMMGLTPVKRLCEGIMSYGFSLRRQQRRSSRSREWRHTSLFNHILHFLRKLTRWWQQRRRRQRSHTHTHTRTNRGRNSTPALSISSHLISSRFNLAQYTSGQAPRQTA